MRPLLLILHAAFFTLTMASYAIVCASWPLIYLLTCHRIMVHYHSTVE